MYVPEEIIHVTDTVSSFQGTASSMTVHPLCRGMKGLLPMSSLAMGKHEGRPHAGKTGKVYMSTLPGQCCMLEKAISLAGHNCLQVDIANLADLHIAHEEVLTSLRARLDEVTAKVDPTAAPIMTAALQKQLQVGSYCGC